jgi:hypothetical protein
MFDKLILAQSGIGWNQLLKGRCSTEWITLFDIIQPGQGEKIATNLLTDIWRAFLTIWKERCDLLHGTAEQTSRHLKETLTPKVLALYAQKYKLDNIDQRILDQAISTVRTMQTRTLRTGLLELTPLSNKDSKVLVKDSNYRTTQSQYSSDQLTTHKSDTTPQAPTRPRCH